MEFELLSGKRICAVTISDKFKCFTGKLFKLLKSHAHSENTGTDIAVFGYLIAEYRS